jgi:serine/threonine protein phosphatase 1
MQFHQATIQPFCIYADNLWEIFSRIKFMLTKEVYAIGDIHGCFEELSELVESLKPKPEKTFIFVGDYIDRGENSRAVIDYIIELKKRAQVITLMGNHEELLLHYLEHNNTMKSATFLYNGGGATLASYSNQQGWFEIPPHHIEFFKSLPLFYQDEKHFFVHAGLPDVSLKELYSDIFRQELLWIRDSFLKSNYNWGKLIVHGHTPLESVQITHNRISIDTGCVFGKKLSAIKLPEKEIFSVPKKKPTNHIYLHDFDARRSTVRFNATIPVRINYRNIDFFFITLNYSELGMLICDAQKKTSMIFAEGTILVGEIGDIDPVMFAGKIVRHQRSADINHYAIQFTITPFEYSMQDGIVQD